MIQKQTVYLPVNEGDSEMSVSYWERDTHIVDVKEERGYFFTPEQLNEYTANVIKQALFSASEFAELQYECGKKSKEKCLAVFCGNCIEQIDRQSITNTFEEVYLKFKQ